MPDLSTQRRVIGGKDYAGGNHVWASHRHVNVEFDSDFYIVSPPINGKNWLKRAEKIIHSIPPVVDVEWFRKRGWFIDPDMRCNDG